MKANFYGLLAVVALAGLSSVPALASDTCTQASGGLTVINDVSVTGNDDLLQGNGTCVMGGFTFSNFDVYTEIGFSSGETFSLVVTTDLTGQPGTLALAYGVSGAATGDFILTYEISPSISGMTVLDGTASSVTENICSAVDGTYGENSTCSEPSLNTTSLLTNDTTTTEAYSPVNPSGTGYDIVIKDVNGGSEIYQAPSSSSSIPEPMTLSLVGGSLLGLGFLGRRRVRK